MLDQMMDHTLSLFGTQNAQTTKALETLQSVKDSKKLQQITEASEDFEAVFLSEMMKPMFETVEVDPMFGGGKGEEVFRSFLVQEYGKILAHTGTIGVTDQVKTALLAAQSELQNGTSFAMTTMKTQNEE